MRANRWLSVVTFLAVWTGLTAVPGHSQIFEWQPVVHDTALNCTGAPVGSLIKTDPVVGRWDAVFELAVAGALPNTEYAYNVYFQSGTACRSSSGHLLPPDLFRFTTDGAGAATFTLNTNISAGCTPPVYWDACDVASGTSCLWSGIFEPICANDEGSGTFDVSFEQTR